MTIDDVPYPPDAHGVGSLLMTGAGLSRDEGGDPYQPLFWFDEASRPLGLVRDEAGHLLAWSGPHHADVEPMDVQRVPDDVERAAVEWWVEQEAAS